MNPNAGVLVREEFAIKHTISAASSIVARLHRHGRTPTEAQVLDAYRELVAANIEKAITQGNARGLPLDAARSAYLRELLSRNTVDA